MNTKNTIATIIGILVVVAVIVLAVMPKKSQTPAATDTPTTQGAGENSGQTSAPRETTNPGAGQDTTPSQPTQAAGTYTMAQIATHNSASSCYSAVNGGVYDLTPWIKQHPGGQQAILVICGKDGSAMFNAQHGSQTRVANILASFKIGVVAK